jgi:hypothetical protein
MADRVAMTYRNRRNMKLQCTRVVALIGVLGLLVVASVSAQTLPNSAPTVPAATAPPTDEATEVNKELSNPISSIWALQIQENTFFIHPGIEDKSSRNSLNVQFQPVVLPQNLIRARRNAGDSPRARCRGGLRIRKAAARRLYSALPESADMKAAQCVTPRSHLTERGQVLPSLRIGCG